MFRLSGLLCLGLAIFAGSLLFKTSQSVQRAEQDLAKVQEQVSTEKDSLRILTAEWDYLNRPERLEKLTLQNLDMDEVHSEKADFIEEGESLPEPYAPTGSKINPQYVSTAPHKGSSSSRKDTIQNAEKNSFNEIPEGTE